MGEVKMKINFGQVLFGISILTMGMFAEAADLKSSEKSSEIPEKRDFKLSSDVNPCDDFHEYVCGDIEKNFKLREDRSAHIFAFDDSDERILEKKKDFFKNIDSEKKLSPRAFQMKAYYNACMNESSAAKEEKELVKNLVTEISQVKTIKDYIELNKKNMTNEKWTFVGYDLSPNINNPKVYDISFDLGFMFLPEHSYYDNAELIVGFRDLTADFFDVIYPNEKREDHLVRAQAIIDFEKRFKDTYPKPADFRKRYTEPRYITRAELFKRTRAIGLEKFFKKNVPTTTLVRDFIPESFEFVQNELKSENLNMLKDMYVYRSARGFMDDAYPELFKKRMAFSHKFLGSAPTRPDRQERCTMSVMGAFNRELDQEMLPRLFPNFPKQKMIDVTTKIRAAIVDGIQSNTWLSEDSKKGALAKITKAKLQIIQPMTDREWDFKPIQKYSSDRPYLNSTKLTLLGQKRTLEKLRKGVNQDAWGMGPLTVNAYYSPDKNKFVMPIGILQYPFFVPEGDVVENLGAVGAVVGHELGHAIDDEGSKFNSEGQLKQWMNDADIQKFKARGEKMKDQFAKIGHNGELTLGENVADLVGLSFGYKAAFPENKGTVEDKKKFFVAYARLWCGVALEKTKEMWLKTDPHSMGYARINEQMKHQSGFQDAYQCKSKNKLYLSEKERIQIW
jgi:putative endopeptidase